MWVAEHIHTHPSATSFTLTAENPPLHGQLAGFWLGFANGGWRGRRKGEATLPWLPEAVGAGIGTVARERGLLGFHADILGCTRSSKLGKAPFPSVPLASCSC